ncbi:rubrerythrin family protein [Falsiroseomonas bella]|uniref:Rubrerythrin family protein n=1 Tax=Falsiroseomonas bella TaxID=2184016 RepID=A0A317FBN5_9PROT|nr:ferritin family protein [Falsiroseomonas bella]PWS35913.1 rubrerythrin family protein [Falsiroseomonas bella]
MSLLKNEPPAPMRSLGELFAMAQALEEEAAARYAELAAEMRAAGLASVAQAFEHLADEERGHAEHVMAWSQARTGHAPDPDMIRWQPPETFDEEEARGIASSRLASAYRALSMAVRNEERAFALWTYIAAQAEDAEIREAAERMAAEELRHATLLRRERRLAYHAGRSAGGADSGSMQRRSPLDQAAHAEAALAALLAELARSPAAPAELSGLAADAVAMAERVARASAAAGEDLRLPSGSAVVPASMEEALRLSESTVEAYLDAAEAARSDEVMRELQALAARAISRTASLRRIAEGS